MTKSTIQIALAGATGRMGKMIARAIAENEDLVLVAASGNPSSKHIGMDIGQFSGDAQMDVVISDNADALIAATPDVIVDFSTVDASLEHIALAADASIPIVVGVTGHDENQLATLDDAAQKTAIMLCSNTSVGITMLTALIEDAARILNTDWDIEISETHHRNKVDAPSGTALTLGDAVARGRNVSLSDVADYARHGRTDIRKKGAIGFAVMRGGDVVGEHSVIFHGQSEQIEITHRASDRMVFAHGALKAARWVVANGAKGQKTGLYSMRNVLNQTGKE